MLASRYCLSMKLRVVTWNIHKGVGGIDRRYELARVVELLREVDPDIALLQEVAEGWPAARFEVQADELRDALDLKHMEFGAEHRFKQGGYGNTILSRWPLSDTHHVDLTVGWRKKRGALVSRIHVREEGHSRSVVLCNLHLGLAGSERGVQLQRFLACQVVASLRSHTPVVVGGDLNDLWGSLGPRFLVPAGFSRAGTMTNTFPAAMPIRPLDGVFVRGDLVVHRCRTVRSQLARTASDHLPLVVDLELH
ncbi:MAG TPA: endonuclease/exonuclease/phosphatase family protein [Polyangiaceae bacterium]